MIAKESKVYFLAGTRRSPPDGPIALGSLISNPRSPEITLNLPHPKIVQKLKVYETVESNQTRSLGKNFGVQPTMWAKFAQEAGFGDVVGEASICYSSIDMSLYTFEKIVTREIFPDIEVVQELFNDPQVQKSIKDRRWQLSVFMITGVQIVYGAKVVVTKAKGTEVHFQTGVELTPVLAPAAVGVGLNLSMAPSQSLSTKYDSPFVFAYRLRQISYRRKKVEKQREYTKGDCIGYNERNVEGAGGDNVIYEV